MRAADRAPIYGFLARLLIREVDETTWRALRDPVLIDFLETAEPGFGDWIAEEPTAERLESLAEEYARLFLVPGGVPLFASAWLEGEPESVAASLSDFVSGVLDALGRETLVAEPWGRLPLDHLALWLDLVVAAAEQDEASAETGPSGDADHLEAQLLGPWVVRFGEALEASAESPLYRCAGKLLRAIRG